MKTPHKHAEVIKAWADGAQIQYQSVHDGRWIDFCGEDDDDPDTGPWSDAPCNWRIKPEPRKGWYRVALLVDGATFTADKSMAEEELEQGEGFVRWLTPRTEYEIEE